LTKLSYAQISCRDVLAQLVWHSVTELAGAAQQVIDFTGLFILLFLQAD
jgi:hypothetical protein